MADAFDEISFLTRSENRVTVLTTLYHEAYGEQGLVDATGISDVTVGRILDDFQARGWVSIEDGVYRTTDIGDLIADDYQRFHETMVIASRLGPAQDLLPFDDLDFDLRHLTNAEILDPEAVSQLRTLDRWRELIREADRVIGVEPASNAAVVLAEPVHEEVTEHDLDVQAVVANEYVERAKGTPELRTLLREMVEAGAELYIAPDGADITLALATIDDQAAISAFDDSGSLRVGILSSADPVYRWVREAYESHRTDAERLEAQDLAD